MNATIERRARLSPCQALRRDGPGCGSDCERRPADGGHDDGGAASGSAVVLGEGEPCLAGQPDVARMELVADLVEAERALADEPAVDARRQRCLTLALEPAGQERADRRRPRASRPRWPRRPGTRPALSGKTKASRPAAKAPMARKIEKNVVLASSSTSRASAATNQMA